jgi:hypothetical protein
MLDSMSKVLTSKILKEELFVQIPKMTQPGVAMTSLLKSLS